MSQQDEDAVLDFWEIAELHRKRRAARAPMERLAVRYLGAARTTPQEYRALLGLHVVRSFPAEALAMLERMERGE